MPVYDRISNTMQFYVQINYYVSNRQDKIPSIAVLATKDC